jgi:excisionase family DNA binding protein
MSRGEGQGRLLTCAAAAHELGLKEATIRAWIARRKLPSVKLGRAVRVPADAVEELIRANTIPAREGRRG